MTKLFIRDLKRPITFEVGVQVKMRDGVEYLEAQLGDSTINFLTSTGISEFGTFSLGVQAGSMVIFQDGCIELLAPEDVTPKHICRKRA